MTFDEFLLFRNVIVRDGNHEKIIRLFYGYMQSVTGNERLLPNIIGELLNIDLSSVTAKTACLNGIFDGNEPLYDNVDLYIKFDNDIIVYVFGSERQNF